jgi:ketosteroid isomerase-like protein
VRLPVPSRDLRPEPLLFVQRIFHLYTVREGKITSMVEHVDRDKALQAAGLSE